MGIADHILPLGDWFSFSSLPHFQANQLYKVILFLEIGAQHCPDIALLTFHHHFFIIIDSELFVPFSLPLLPLLHIPRLQPPLFLVACHATLQATILVRWFVGL